MAKLLTSATNLGNNIVKVGRPRLETFLKFAKVELTPPSLSDGPAIAKSINQIRNSAVTGKWKQLTVKEGIVNSLIVAEVGMCFFIGECIGKGSVIGYQIPGTMHTAAEF